MSDSPVIPPTIDHRQVKTPRPLGEALTALKARLAARGITGDNVDWEEVEAEIDAEMRADQAAIRREAWAAIVPEDMRRAVMDVVDPKAADPINRWLIAEPPTRGNVILVGPVGVGKTFAAYAIGHALVDVGEHVYAVTTAALLKAMRPEGDRRIEERARAAAYLILDDLGAEALTEWGVSVLTDVLDERFRERRPTVVTANASYRDLAARLGERIMSRLTGGAVVVTIDGHDRRRQTWG